MKNYREQIACINCEHSRDASWEYDGSDLRCSFGTEVKHPTTEWEYLKWVDTMPKINICGICDNHKRRKE